MTELFRNRLQGMEMDVRDGFWEGLQTELPKATVLTSPQKHILFQPKFRRWVAAASAALLLGAASATLWYFSPQEEIKEAFTQAALQAPETCLMNEGVQEVLTVSQSENKSATRDFSSKPSASNNPNSNLAMAVPAALQEETEPTDESLSLHVSITITHQVYGITSNTNTSIYNASSDNSQGTANHAAMNSDAGSFVTEDDEMLFTEKERTDNVPHGWFLKTAIGTSLPKDGFEMPVSASFSVERNLNSRLSLESGIQYHYLAAKTASAEDAALHTLSVPVKLNVLLANSSRVDLYASGGMAAEKSVNKSFSEDPVRLSASIGLGVRYRLNERLALFAEPSLSHHFDTDGEIRSLRTERATNMNLLCGLRMTY